MKAITIYLDSIYVPWRLLAGLLMLSFLLSLLYITRLFGQVDFKGFYAVGRALYPLAMAFLCFRGTSRLFKETNVSLSSVRARQRFIPVLLGMGLLCLALGNVAWLLEVLILGRPPTYPSLTYFIYLGTYPFFICVIFLLPSQDISMLTRLRIFLDSLIIMVTVTTLCYYFLLGPLLANGYATLTAKILGSVFPAADLVLMFCLLLVALRSGERVLQPVLIMLGLAIPIIFANHTLHLYQLLHQGYDENSWISLGWLFGMVLAVGAAQTMSRILNSGVPVKNVSLLPHTDFPMRWKSVFTYGLALIFGLIVFFLKIKGGREEFPGQFIVASIGGFIVLILMILRQFLATYEVGTLQRTLQEKNRSLRVSNVQLEQLATTDPLTGLPNHRALVHLLDEELAYAHLHHLPCSIIFVDIDNLKDINDQYGHQTGDMLLCRFGAVVQSMLYAGECIGRWGGEEFVVILPGRDPGDAFAVAERVRTTVAQQHFNEQSNMRVTCSLGVSTYPHDTSERATLLQFADMAMYASKRLGRNQTRMAHEPMVLAVGMVTDGLKKTEETEMLSMVEAFLALQEARDQVGSQHARDVATLSMKLALALGLSESQAYLISMGGLLHDLGKVTLPDALLFKIGKLTADETKVVARHPIISAEILGTVPALHRVAAIVRAHHERMDGLGYPDGLKGNEIPLGARIVSVADAYDALTTNRSEYLRGSPTQTLQDLQERAGSQFDPQVVEALVKLFSPTSQLPVPNVA